MGKFNEIIKNVKQSFDGNDIDINILQDKVVIDSTKKVIEVNNTLRATNVEINGVSSVAFTLDEKEKLNKITTPMQVIGRVDSVEMLPTTDVAIGYVYLVGLEGCADFEEYIVISLEPTEYESLGKMVTAADWLQTDETAAGYVANKPAILAGSGTNSIVECDLVGNIATGNYSHAEGSNTRADGNYSHTEGSDTTARGAYSHAEGSTTTANGIYSHAEGSSTTAAGIYSHTEGNYTTAYGDYAHAEGERTKASGHYSHAEGSYSEANGRFGHAEGAHTMASGECSHAEGNGTNITSLAYAGHAEGQLSTVSGTAAHAEGRECTASGLRSHAEGYQTTAAGDMSHTQGTGTQANRKSQTAIGEFNIADGTGATARGNYIEIAGNGTDDSNRSNARTLDWLGNEVLAGALFVGGNVTANGVNLNSAISELQQSKPDWNETDGTAVNYISNKPAISAGAGANAIIQTGNIATVNLAIAVGEETTATGAAAIASGYACIARGQYSHAEGHSNEANGVYSHAEGRATETNGDGAHAEGYVTTANGQYSHAEGGYTEATGTYSHAEGEGTTANHRSQHTAGEFNIADPSTSLATTRGNFIEIIGNGTDTANRSNARTLDWQGNEYIQGTEEALLFIGHAPSNENINGNLVWGIANIQRLKFVTLNSATNTLTLPIGGSKPFSLQMKVIQDATGGRGLVINCAGDVNVFNMDAFDFSVGAATQRCLVTLLWDSSEWWYTCSEYFG